MCVLEGGMVIHFHLFFSSFDLLQRGPKEYSAMGAHVYLLFALISRDWKKSRNLRNFSGDLKQGRFLYGLLRKWGNSQLLIMFCEAARVILC